MSPLGQAKGSGPRPQGLVPLAVKEEALMAEVADSLKLPLPSPRLILLHKYACVCPCVHVCLCVHVCVRVCVCVCVCVRVCNKYTCVSVSVSELRVSVRACVPVCLSCIGVSHVTNLFNDVLFVHHIPGCV